jgi:hypothetical protein
MKTIFMTGEIAIEVIPSNQYLTKNKVGPNNGSDTNQRRFLKDIVKPSIRSKLFESKKKVEQEETQETIPTRSTVVSAIFIVPLVMSALVFQLLKLETRERMVLIKAHIEILLVLRCPLTTFLTYKSKKKQQAMTI